MKPQIFDNDSGDFVLPDLPYEYGKNKGISEDTDKFHHDKHFAGYIKGLNSVDEKLAQMRGKSDFSGIRSAMLSFSHNASGAFLHDIYYSILGGDGEMNENLEVVQKIMKDFGNQKTWREEFKAVAGAGRGWALLGYFEADSKLRNCLVDFHDLHIPAGFRPVIAIDMWEHAYYYDHGPDKSKYIEGFLQSLNWSKVNEIYMRVTS